ncbi:MAG: MerC domain-containing protein [Pseudomonadota bacterium]
MPRLDRIAIFLSGLCFLHCLALPLAFLLTPLLSDWLHESETVLHWILFGAALPISAIALGRGYMGHKDRAGHKDRWTIILGSIGLLLMLIGVSHITSLAGETTLTLSGVMLLMWAHIRNMTRHHNHPHPSH